MTTSISSAVSSKSNKELWDDFNRITSMEPTMTLFVELLGILEELDARGEQVKECLNQAYAAIRALCKPLGVQ
jgi:hypothetical protein